MNYLLMIITIMFLVACSDYDRSSDVTDAEKKGAHDKQYKTPPPADRSKDKGF